MSNEAWVIMPRQPAQALLNDLNARIDQAHSTSVPVFAGIVALHEAVNRDATRTRKACAALPDHADIMETIEDAADDWRAKGYTSALAEVRDMAAVGRSLMEALPQGYCYSDSPAEIVSDLQNELDEARAALSAGGAK